MARRTPSLRTVRETFANMDNDVRMEKGVLQIFDNAKLPGYPPIGLYGTITKRGRRFRVTFYDDMDKADETTATELCRLARQSAKKMREDEDMEGTPRDQRLPPLLIEMEGDRLKVSCSRTWHSGEEVVTEFHNLVDAFKIICSEAHNG